ncbi:MazG nucleotide pyrophosphohydrolase domain-containing protein [Propionicimonas sp.]|uniref:MazG nucleotide pyrophosphohydrolase domain-containing protein n=1 Tax=Propionicimonas sp. TaxID=1955623 RepID=UPI0039E3440C
MSELERLVAVMHRLRSGCPWDAEQTHLTLVRYLVEETLEVVEAIEAGTDDHLAEELGDLLLQVVFHAEIAAQDGRFDIEDVAGRIADKLVARHPYVFGDGAVPDDLVGSWERAKAVEKSRASALDGIPQQLSALTRAHKVLVRARSHGLPPEVLGVRAGEASSDALGQEFIALVARAEELGLDPEQEARAALRALESRVRYAEASRG